MGGPADRHLKETDWGEKEINEINEVQRHHGNAVMHCITVTIIFSYW